VQRIALEDMKAAAAAKAAGVELVSWSPEERKKFRNLSQQAWAEWAKRSPAAQKVYESQIAFLKQLQLLD
jgi:TRAP-type mannitol/chloroaromatic compound transport system substrate-binding protein